MGQTVYTIGHSTHEIEYFIDLLKEHRIEAVADVRSQPFSRYNPQFNREHLQASLKSAGISYVFLGRELGARSENEDCYVDGKVQYDLLAATSLFQKGLTRLSQGAQTYRIALMCAEKDPLTCHRSILVCRHLIDQGMEVRHILEDGEIETHDDALARLLREEGLPEQDLFRDRAELIAAAYEQRGRDIAYVEKDPE